MTTLVSVDLDDLWCYHAIHGLAPPPAALRGVVLRRWLPRFLALFESLDVRATFFVIGRDLADDEVGQRQGVEHLRCALAAGHELGNHSHAHAYDLVRWPAERQRDDLLRCDEALRRLGATPRGFRAPGYTHDDGLLRVVRGLGYRYDSSRLPSPPYYVAKLSVMAWMRLRGRSSSSLAGGAASFFGPTTPHYRTTLDLWSVPMSVTRYGRVPLIGTSLLSAPTVLAAGLGAAARRLPYFHLELHGIDLADPQADDLAPALCRRQPELRVPLSVRRERLAALLRDRGGGAPCGSVVPGERVFG